MASIELLTAQEVAPLLRVTVPTVYRWADDGTIPSVTIGKNTIRFRRSDIEALLAGASVEDEAAS